MTKQEAKNAIIELAASNVEAIAPNVGRIYILEETADASVRVVTWVENRLTKSTYDSVAKALTGNVYLFKVTKVNQHKYMDLDYNTVRIHTHSIDGELRCMAD